MGKKLQQKVSIFQPVWVAQLSLLQPALVFFAASSTAGSGSCPTSCKASSWVSFNGHRVLQVWYSELSQVQVIISKMLSYEIMCGYVCFDTLMFIQSAFRNSPPFAQFTNCAFCTFCTFGEVFANFCECSNVMKGSISLEKTLYIAWRFQAY